MFLSDKTMRLLVESGLPPDKLVTILQSLREDEEAARPITSAAAKRQAKYRANKAQQSITDHNAVAVGDADHNEASPAPPSRPLSPQTPLTPTHPPERVSSTRARGCGDFERFWTAYPRKTAKDVARKAFPGALSRASVETMIAALERQREWEQWRRGIIPHPATWLRQSRWNDEDPPESDPRKAKPHERPDHSPAFIRKAHNLAAAEEGFARLVAERRADRADGVEPDPFGTG